MSEFKPGDIVIINAPVNYSDGVMPAGIISGKILEHIVFTEDAVTAKHKPVSFSIDGIKYFEWYSSEDLVYSWVKKIEELL